MKKLSLFLLFASISTGALGMETATSNTLGKEKIRVTIPYLSRNCARNFGERLRSFFWPTFPETTLTTREIMVPVESGIATYLHKIEIYSDMLRNIRDNSTDLLLKETVTARSWRLSALSALGIFYGAHKALKSCHSSHPNVYAVPCALASYFILKPVYNFINERVIFWTNDYHRLLAYNERLHEYIEQMLVIIKQL